MKVLYYDCFSGISGDMNLGSMIDLGVDASFLKTELEKLNLEGWELLIEKAQRHGITGTKVTVKQTIHSHHHRHLSDIEKIIKYSSLRDSVKNLSMRIFMKIAEAEAKVHGTTVDKVHFHEVGAIDSIIDIVGAAICYEALGVDEVFVSEIELGSGFVDCDHGRLPVPAPATIEIIKGMPVRTGGVGFEATTPTGAAILSALATGYGTPDAIKIGTTGYGIGHKENPGVPNILRVALGETDVTVKTGHRALLIESNIDDMNPEFYDHISEQLFNAGASEVYLTQVIMKKGRPGVVLSVICEPGNEDNLKEILFTESTTLGLRTFEFTKDTLEREFSTIDTEYGAVKVKRSFYKGLEVSAKPEYEDCKRIASGKGLPVKEVYGRIASVISGKKNK